MLQTYFTKLLKCRQIARVQNFPNLRYMHAAATENSSKFDSFSLEQTHIDEAIKLSPILSSAPIEIWRRSHETFVNHGINTTGFLRIVTGNPSVLTRSPQKIIESIERWRGCQFGEKLLHLLITKYPELLNVNDWSQIAVTVAVLKELFGNSKNIWKILMNSPDLLHQNAETIRQKFDYIKDIMRIEIPEIIKSQALSQTYAEIKCRHIFLVRLGLFIPRPPKADPNIPTKNHRLYKIMDTSEKTFATKICHVTLVEYETFKELFAREQKRKQNADDEEENELNLYKKK
ncbi:transcription termination factor 4, mitochondrial [Teleopsis dalmanni]|uniref:transcription termination factor 4, mitochondrial n=1 Tax=Teleopsis dalmanni TaxID=139649 RepID=UPI0018CCCE55|nr:transcription termination factor 4, mitochondrial [Teleopsis dalmanni]